MEAAAGQMGLGAIDTEIRLTSFLTSFSLPITAFSG